MTISKERADEYSNEYYYMLKLKDEDGDIFANIIFDEDISYDLPYNERQSRIIANVKAVKASVDKLLNKLGATK